MSPDPKHLSRERFARHAAAYVTSESHARGADLSRLVELAAPEASWEVLDVATGGGHTAIALAPLVARVVALDLTPEMLTAAADHARGRGVTGIEFVVGDAESLPFPDASFDLVTCRIAAHHFPDVPRFLAEVARVLRPGGRLALQDQCVPAQPAAGAFLNLFERVRDPSHACAYSQEAWHTMLARAGFVVDAAEQHETRHLVASWAARQECSPEVVVRLHELLDQAPDGARMWARPEGEGADRAFVIRHVLIAAHRADGDVRTDARI